MPNVKTVIGSVKKIKSGLTIRFKIDKTKEIIIAAGTPLTLIPESIQSVMMTAKVIVTKRAKKTAKRFILPKSFKKISHCLQTCNPRLLQK